MEYIKLLKSTLFNITVPLWETWVSLAASVVEEVEENWPEVCLLDTDTNINNILNFCQTRSF